MRRECAADPLPAEEFSALVLRAFSRIGHPARARRCRNDRKREATQGSATEVWETCRSAERTEQVWVPNPSRFGNAGLLAHNVSGGSFNSAGSGGFGHGGSWG